MWHRDKAKARILQIGNYPPPVCGWAIHTQSIQRALAERGAECQVLDIGFGRRIPGRNCVPVYNGFDYVAKLLIFRFRGYTFEPHVNGETWKGYLLVLVAVLLGRLTGKPSVLMFHAGPKQLYFPRNWGPWRWAFWLLFHASSRIICNLESVQHEIVKYGVPPEKVHPIFAVNYQPEEIPVPLPKNLERFLQQHEPRLFSYSMFRPGFTVEWLFEAFARLREHFPRAGLVIAGPREVPMEIQAEMRRWGIEHDVLVPGNLPRPEFLTAMKRSDVFARCALTDGLCASVLEALSLGVPVVAAENGNRPTSVVTYAPTGAGELFLALRDVLDNLRLVREQVRLTELRSDLNSEVGLLLSVASPSTAFQLPRTSTSKVPQKPSDHLRASGSSGSLDR